MVDPRKPSESLPPSSSKLPPHVGEGGAHSNNHTTSFSGHKAHFPNPPDAANPDPATLREQWRFAIKQYSRWYSQAWGTAILAGISFFALGWIIKGGNPLPSLQDKPHTPSSSDSDANQTQKS